MSFACTEKPVVVPGVAGAEAVEVETGADGQDVGVVTVSDVDYNFKVSVRPVGNPFLFADGTTQNVALTIKNVGTVRSLAPTYTLASLSPGLSLGGTFTNNLSTFEPDTEQTLTVPITVSSITGDVEDLTISVTLEI